ncbi:MAG TPA: RsmG family class I SAM-dependent methyltransferase [Acidimicrobiia bacterium]|nr:RsmG family class I SAM-dependent methyltransferase [Acidimicrobiia bacterium]
MEHSHLVWTRCAEWTGRRLTPSDSDKLEEYRDWLLTEAVPAGGIGPYETERIDNRHIGDSLLFAGGFPTSPGHILDVGSGVGLPGIPLSIIMPETGFSLLDRSGRRVQLMKRAVRVLQLQNVEVVHGDISNWQTQVDGIVSRASLSPDQAVTSFSRILGPGGRAVVGGSWASPPNVVGFDLMEVPGAVLDQRVWLLIMRSQ